MLLLYAVIGLLVGGVLNALADTLPHKTRLRRPYCSHCDATRKPVAWLATTGYLLARGRCSNCDAPLSLRGVLVELTTAVVFGFLFARDGLTGHMVLLSVYVAILILITVIDLEHRLVLNRVIGPAILLALIAGPFTPGLNWKQMLVGGLVAFFLFYLAALLYPGGMGAGDVKLAAFIGLITGFPAVFLALLVTVFAGGLISLLLVVTRIRSRRDYIPYGPFLVIGGAFALFWGQPIVDSYVDLDQEARSTEPVLAGEVYWVDYSEYGGVVPGGDPRNLWGITPVRFDELHPARACGASVDPTQVWEGDGARDPRRPRPGRPVI